jgi:hypothetical protein
MSFKTIQERSLREKNLGEIMGGDVVRIKLLRDWAVDIINYIDEILPKVAKSEIHYIKLWSDRDSMVYSIRELSGIKKFLMERFDIMENELHESGQH